MPRSAECLEMYYESMDASKRTSKTCPIEAWLAHQEAIPDCPEPLSDHCGADSKLRLADPNRSAEKAPVRGGASRIPAKRLERCPGCARAFRPDLLQGHVKQCAAARQLGRAKARVPGEAARSLARGRTRKNREKGRQAPARASRAGTRAPSPESPPPLVDEAHSSSGLLASRQILPASAADTEALQGQLVTSIPGAEFVGAFRVSHKAQHGVYAALRAGMHEQRGGREPPEERDLWHGTTWATVPKILEQGFNRIFAGRHGTLLGVATYFSTDIAYSQRFCDRGGGGRDSTKVAILARVLVGRYSRGASTDVEPPLIDGDGGERYDSTVDNEECPKIFAIFRDFQALPLFLVEFRS